MVTQVERTLSRAPGTTTDLDAQRRRDGARPERMLALDGLRGVAAVIVVFYHLTLIARPYIDNDSGVWDWITQSPLKTFTAGTEAVLVFFVLSGFVVALPALAGAVDWVRYYTSRMLRLYIPVWGSLLFAALLIMTLPRLAGNVAPDSWLVDRNAVTVLPHALVSEATLLPATYTINNPLWSLRWEVIFSVLLPLFVVVALAVRRHRLITVIVAGVTMVAGRVLEVDALVYLPTFFLGTFLAANLDALRAWAERVNSRRGKRSGWLVWFALGVGSALLLVLSWLARPLAPAESTPSAVLWAFSGLGAAGLVIVAICSPLAVKALSLPIPMWFGKISFSLYLVHVPVIASLAFLIGDDRWKVVAIIALPATVAIAWLFHVAVEKPSHAVARKVGNRASSLLGRSHAPTGA